MSNILPFKRRKSADKHNGRILCDSNHHKWEVVKDRRFDVKSGKLVTVEKCARCGKLRHRLS